MEELKVSSTIGRYQIEELGTHSLSSLGRRIAENNGQMPTVAGDPVSTSQTNQGFGGIRSVLLRSLNDHTRLFINEEDEDEESEEDDRTVNGQEREKSQPVSLISPQRSLNTTFNNLQLRNLNQNQPSIE